MVRYLLFVCVCFCVLSGIEAQENRSLRRKDTVPDRLFVSRKKTDTAEVKETFWRRLLSGSRDRTFEKRFDFSAAAVPKYTYEGSFGIGAMAAAAYRIDRRDSSLLPSDITLEGSASLRGFFYVGVSGNTYFPKGRHRLLYDFYFEQQNKQFWGLDYEECSRQDPTFYRRWNFFGKINYDYRVFDRLYMGAMLDLSYSSAVHVGDPDYFKGQDTWYYLTGFGISLQYDSRDVPRYPTQGCNVFFRPMVYPAACGTYGRTIWRFTFNADYFQWLWRGGVLAFDFFAQNNLPDVPWMMKEAVGGEYRLRGYYDGRYMDNNMVSFQVELRQRLFWRIGMVLFGGCGAVYPSLKEWEWERILPSYGLGLRLEFKKGINVRVDYALGRDAWKGEGGIFVLSIGESF